MAPPENILLACLDGDVVALSEAKLSVTDDGLLRGDGVFEVVRLYRGHPYTLGEHLARMRHSGEALRLDVDVLAFRGDIEKLLACDPKRDGALRLIFTRGGHRLVLTEELPVLPATFALGSITYAPTRVLDGVKSLSYAANMLSTRLAQEQGRDEALLVSPEGHILETPTSSFFWAGEEGVLYTPPLSEHILDSITRRTIVSENEVQEKVTLYDDLHVMKEAFITSSVKEIISVHAIDDVQLGDPGPLTLQADSRLQEHIKRELR